MINLKEKSYKLKKNHKFQKRRKKHTYILKRKQKKRNKERRINIGSLDLLPYILFYFFYTFFFAIHEISSSAPAKYEAETVADNVNIVNGE